MAPIQSPLVWKKSGEAFLLTHDGLPLGSLMPSPEGYDFDIGPCRFQVQKRGFIKPWLALLDEGGAEMGRVQRYCGFEPRIELGDGSSFRHRELREGSMSHAITDAEGLVLETQDMSTWDSPSMRIDLRRRDVSPQQCAYLAGVAMFIFLERRQGRYLPRADRS